MNNEQAATFEKIFISVFPQLQQMLLAISFVLVLVQ
jgi:hypothetical protein